MTEVQEEIREKIREKIWEEVKEEVQEETLADVQEMRYKRSPGRSSQKRYGKRSKFTTNLVASGCHYLQFIFLPVKWDFNFDLFCCRFA